MLLSVLANAPTAWAHGKELYALFFGVSVCIPAALLLFVPWHHWPARMSLVALLLVLTVVVWYGGLPFLVERQLSSATEWLIVLSPTIVTFLLAVALHFRQKNTAG